MKQREKIEYLENNHFGEWFTTSKSIREEMSNTQDMWCVCGRLATGLHESMCTKFRNKITSETVKRLSYLLK
jgi:hypothetical protein